MENTSMISIDGSLGEGGGQVLRTALSLSIITGKAFTLERIRAKRERPGLLRQHLASVKAAAAISDARIEGAELGSSSLVFVPGTPRSGSYDWAIGSAGSSSLVLQTVLLPLFCGGSPSEATISGGTHNAMSPPLEFLDWCFRPLALELGYSFALRMTRVGFYPAGGGQIHATISGCAESASSVFSKTEREILGMEAWAWSSGIPERIGRAEVELLGRELGIAPEMRHACMVDSIGPGNAVAVVIELRDGKVMFTGFGEPRLPLEKVVAGCIAQVRRYVRSGARIDEHLQDQLLLPLSLGRGGAFTTTAPSLHTKTNMEIIGKFLPTDFHCDELADDLYRIEVVPRNGRD